MRTAGARALREHDNETAEREAVLTAWEQKSLSLLDESPLRTRRFQRREERPAASPGTPPVDNVIELGERRRAGSPESRRPESAERRSSETADRRTVTITGHPTRAHRPRRSAAQQHLAAQPDRVALWAVLLGLFLVVVAAGTANAAPL